jgi:hypothetical protein
VFGTLTLAQPPNAPLGISYKHYEEVRSRFRRKIRAIEKLYGIEHSVIALEETFATGTRWHVHLHAIWFIPHQYSEKEFNTFTDAALKAWREAAALAGYITSHNAQEFRELISGEQMRKAATYLTKHGFYPSEPPTPTFRGSYAGISAFEVLEAAKASGDTLLIGAYNEFESLNLGRHRIVKYKTKCS